MIYFFFGDDTYRARKAIDAALEKYAHEYPHGSVESVDFAEEGMEAFGRAIESPSLFSSNKCIVGRNPFALSASSQEGLLTLITRRGVQENRDIRIILWQEGRHGARTRLFRVLSTKPVHVYEFPSLQGDALAQFVKRVGLRKGVHLSREVLKGLIARTGENLWLIDQELEKIASVSPEVTPQHLELFVAPVVSPSIFAILDAVAEKKKAGVYSAVKDYYAKGASPLALLAMLAYQVRNLIKVKSLYSAGVPHYRISTEVRLHPFVAKKTLAQSRLFTIAELRRIYGRLFETELAIKTGRVDTALAVDLFLATL